MITQHIAIVSEAPSISLSELAPVSAAIQKQATRDFGPIWNVQATIDCFGSLEDMPGGYWPITLRESNDPADPNGIHEDENEQPFALVYVREGWSISISHEVLEMLVNPFGRKTVSGPSPVPNQGRVDFMLEVCDPCEARSYLVNGIAVSDFYTPHYFDPVTNSSVRYSFTGALTEPRQVLNGGYLSWYEPVAGKLFRQSIFGNKMLITDLGKHVPTGQSLRSIIYAKTPDAYRARVPAAELVLAQTEALSTVRLAARSRAEMLRRHISKLAKNKNEA